MFWKYNFKSKEKNMFYLKNAVVKLQNTEFYLLEWLIFVVN